MKNIRHYSILFVGLLFMATPILCGLLSCGKSSDELGGQKKIDNVINDEDLHRAKVECISGGGFTFSYSVYQITIDDTIKFYAFTTGSGVTQLR